MRRGMENIGQPRPPKVGFTEIPESTRKELEDRVRKKLYVSYEPLTSLEQRFFDINKEFFASDDQPDYGHRH